MHHFIEKRIFLYEYKTVNKNVKAEVKFWCNNISIYNRYTFKPRPLTSCLLFTDTSDESYGRFVMKHLNKGICLAKLDNYEKKTSSAFRELLAVNYVPTSSVYILKNQSVKLNTNNYSTRILSTGA